MSPTVVLVHGAFADASSWNGVIERLQAQGVPVKAAANPLQARLAEAPAITVPTITLEGDANGAPHPHPSSYAGKFSGRYSHRTVEGGVGHNLPQEAPAAFADAVLEVGGAR
jgi:pimeloyl-ACP methyl ester carboxylesterase